MIDSLNRLTLAAATPLPSSPRLFVRQIAQVDLVVKRQLERVGWAVEE
jgi:hypothetical protein